MLYCPDIEGYILPLGLGIPIIELFSFIHLNVKHSSLMNEGNIRTSC